MTNAATRSAVIICCVFAPLVAVVGCFVAIVPDAWKLPLVALELVLIVLMGIVLGYALRQAKREGGR